MIQNTDPTDADTLGPGGQPEILNGAAGTIQICCTHCGAAEYIPPPTVPATCHAEIDRRFFDAFQLQLTIEGSLGGGIPGGRLGVGISK